MTVWNLVKTVIKAGCWRVDSTAMLGLVVFSFAEASTVANNEKARNRTIMQATPA